MTDLDAQHPPVSFQGRPDHALPSLVSSGRRRSTARKPKHPRRGRWIATFGFSGIVVLLGIVNLFVTGNWIFFAACLMFAVVTFTTQYLAEADIALSKVRADAEKRQRHAAERELRTVHEHFELAHDLIRQKSAATADDLLAGLNLDLLRIHTMSTRIESDSR